MRFRFKALQRMREPDELDSPTLLASPRGWIATFVVLIVVAGVTVWAFVGRLPINVSAAGLLTHPGGTALMQSPYSGMVRKLFVHPDDSVTQGQLVAEITPVSGQPHLVTSPFTGHVVAAAVDDGHMVAVGENLLTVERTDAPDDRLVAMLFVPADQTLGVVPGRAVDIAVSTAPPGSFGLLRGRVASVGTYPLVLEELSDLVGGEAAARAYLKGTPPRLVIVDLDRDPRTASGYAWSTKAGPPVRLQSQVNVTGSIGLGSQTLFDLLLGR
ncbi:HlyD family efflux transporter periplasmic adaptor subunit [Microbispora sp. NBC_01389]|uniref:HlyD family efflux transporter periplasmic adaptor subunit n=1 Tax=Microbispora sp. NBC_01389 TaxID=2903584 RepID=UPI00324FA087